MKRAHAFKGLCLNLGAARLGNLCKKAQDCGTAKPEEKQKLLRSIQTEFENVKRYLEKYMDASNHSDRARLPIDLGQGHI
jgi:HPt (histidine-containing phosphotransfer) domain-containing protein